MRQFHKPSGSAPGKDVAGPVKSLKTQEGKPGTLVMADGATTAGACINCPDTPCVYFSEAEVASPVLTTFPFNRSREVCPFDALSVDVAQSIPIINSTLCIGCGLCVSRCPANALYSGKDGVVVLNNEENAVFKKRAAQDPKAHATTVKNLRVGVWEGTIRTVDEETLADVLASVGGTALSPTKQKLLIRNLLLCLGAQAAISTVGDTNVRIDMWFKAQKFLWVTEVDFDEVSLVDSPRGLVDDVAVCVNRHKVPLKEIGAAIVCLEFPNKRSDYYHLVEDIEKVIKLGIRSIPVAGLFVLLWTHDNINSIDIAKDCKATRGQEGVAVAFKKLPGSLAKTRYFIATK